MKIKHAHISWDRHYSNCPDVSVVLSQNWPKLRAFKFERFVVDDCHMLYRGVCNYFVHYYLHNYITTGPWDESQHFHMSDGTIALARGAFNSYALPSAEFFYSGDMDVTISTPDDYLIKRTVTLEGAKLIAAKAGFDIAKFTETGFLGVQKEFVEPIEPSEPGIGTRGLHAYEKIFIANEELDA